MGGEAQSTVLVADDDPTLRLLCRVNLELEGYRVLEAKSGEEVEALVASDDVSALLLDVRLGKDDGLEIARRVRETQPSIGIAFLTGSIDRESASRGVADAFISKPFNLDELIATVRRLARR